MDTMYDPPSGMLESKQNKNIMQYKYDESSGRVRRISGAEREKICGIKKKHVYLGMGFFVMFGVIAGVMVTFKANLRNSTPVSGSAVSVYRLCRTDKDCKGTLECFVSDDVIDDESERAKKFHGQCLKPTGNVRHCKKSTDCKKGYECVVDKEIFRGTCTLKVASKETAPMKIDFVRKVGSSSNGKRRLVEGRVCCSAYMAKCLACSSGQSVEEYCANNVHGHVPGCPEHSHHGHHHGDTEEVKSDGGHHHEENMEKTHLNGIVKSERKRWEEEGFIHPFNPSSEHDDGVCGTSQRPRVILDEQGRKVHSSHGRRLNVGSQCAYNQCDIPENRDKFLNVKLHNKIPVEYYVITNSHGEYPSRRVAADFDDSLQILNQKYGPMGMEFTGEIKGIKNDDLFMMNVGAVDSWKDKLEGAMLQDVSIEKGFQGKKFLVPVKPLSVLKGKYDWQYLRQGDVMKVHRSVQNGFVADELMEEGLIATETSDAGEKGSKQNEHMGRKLRQAAGEFENDYRQNSYHPRQYRPRQYRPRQYRPRQYRPRQYRPIRYENDQPQQYWGPVPRHRPRPSYGGYGSRYRNQMVRYIIQSYKKDQIRTKKKLLSLFIKSFLMERKYRQKMDNKTATEEGEDKEVKAPLKEPSSLDSMADSFKIHVYQCTTCTVLADFCPVVSERKAECRIIHTVESSFKELESKAFEYKPQQPGWYVISLDFSQSSPTLEQKVVQLNVQMDGSYISQEELLNKMGTRRKRTKALQFYLFNVAVDKYLGWAFPPHSSDELDVGLVALNNYRLSKGSSTLPHELGHTFGLWHTFHGTHEQGMYDENGNTVFEGDTKAQIKARNNAFEKILKQKSGNLVKDANNKLDTMDMKQKMDENPLDFIADTSSCPICVESPGAPDDHRDRVGDFCSDTRPIPKQWQCSNPSSSGICGSGWGETPFNNIMSYGKDTCREHFTKQQKARILCYLHTTPKFAEMLNLKVVENVGAFTPPAAESDSSQDTAFDMSEPMLDDIDEVGHPYGEDEGRSVSREGKSDKRNSFPKHWGTPPRLQTRDLVKLPENFGYGSSTLKRWIQYNIQKDGGWQSSY